MNAKKILRYMKALENIILIARKIQMRSLLQQAMKRWQNLIKVDIQVCYRQLIQKVLTTKYLSSVLHIIFNSASQKSYITLDLKKHYIWKQYPMEELLQKTFGLTEKRVSFVDVVKFKIECRNRQRFC